MKSVLISIRPKWCELIASGKKTVELRKTVPKLPLPFKCYIYMTKGYASYPVSNGMMCHNNGGGHVIGEFICDEIVPICVFENGSIQNWNHFDLPRACVSYDDMARYIGDGKKGYGWHISELVIYDKPKELREFFNPCVKKNYPYCFECEHGLQEGEERYLDGLRHYDIPCGNRVKRPPQSWCYVE